MTTAATLEILRVRIQARFPLLFLATWEEERWESELASLALSMDRGLVIWTATEGPCPALEDAAKNLTGPNEFLDQIRLYPRDHVFLLKDFHPFLNDPLVVRRLRDLVPTLAEQNKTLLFMSPDPTIPIELRRDAVALHLPLPGVEDLRSELQELLIQRQHNGELTLRMSREQQERMLKAVLGLTARQARQTLTRALTGRNAIDDEVFSMLVSEKKHMVQGSEMLEFQELSEGVGDIGGLDALKDWMAKRALAFGDEAQRKGIPSPKGVLLLGVQGCGKSLTARAVARMLSFPLVRLDIATLLSSDRGQSEKNLRDVLTLMEMIAPAVLWLDEVEKGFAGVDTEGGGGDSTMIRLMGRFLTWMQEKSAPVFIVATANSVTGLPPEMLRRGRFDELFFVDLPNYHERKAILGIHLRKRRFDPANFDIGRLADLTEGYSGAEIEQVVLTAMVESFHRKQSPNQKDMEDSAEETVPLSVTMEEKIFQLREWARPRCRPATPDSRVLQMLEAEQREKTGQDDNAGLLQMLDDELGAASTAEPKTGWRETAKSGELKTAIYEYVSEKERIDLRQLQTDFAEVLDPAGEFGIALRSDPHIVLWLGVSADFAVAIVRLITDRKIYAIESTAVNRDDPVLARLTRLPALPDSRVSRACWLPVLLSVTAPESVDERLTRVARMKLNK